MNYRTHEDEKKFFATFNLMEQMKALSFIDEDIRTYFYRYNKLFRAIVDYIARSKEECVLIKKTDPIVICRGRGASVSYRDCHGYCSDYKTDQKTGKTIEIKPTVFCLKVSVRFADSEEVESGYENPREFEREFNIQVPIDLQLNFSEKKFNAWIKDLSAKKKAAQAVIDEKELKRLINKYPNQAASILMKKENANA